MARVQMYTGQSSVIPIFHSSTAKLSSLGLLKTQIKQEEDEDPLSGDDLWNDEEGSSSESPRPDDQRLITPDPGQDNPDIGRRLRSNTVSSPQSSTRSRTNSKIDDNQSKIMNISTELGLDQGHAGNIRGLRGSLRTRSSPILFECNICHITFVSKTNLKIHQIRKRKKSMTCHVCKQDFVNPIALASHRRSDHRAIDWSRFRFKCNYCNLSYTKKNNLQQHIFHTHNINEISKTQKRRNERFKLSPSLRNSIHLPRETKLKRSKPKDWNDDTFNTAKVNKIQKMISTNVTEKLFEKDNFVDIDSTHGLSNGLEETESTLLKEHPLVTIFPFEVEALLADDHAIPIKSPKKELDAVESEVDSDRDRPQKKYSLRSGLRSFDTSRYNAKYSPPSRSTLRQWALLRRRFKCKNIKITLERIKLPLNHGSQQNNLPTSPTNHSVGVELHNLDLALQKMSNDVSPTVMLDASTDDEGDRDNEENLENTQSLRSPSTYEKRMRPLYRSSICRTRFTTQKKLIYHYLYYHTTSGRHECAICRSKFSRFTELKKHLALHCIAIPKSDLEKSPIDLKGPCERYRKKLTCRRCKQNFTSELDLQDHKENCTSLQQEKEHSLRQDENSSPLVPRPEVETRLQTNAEVLAVEEVEANDRRIDNSSPDSINEDIVILSSSAENNQDQHTQLQPRAMCKICHSQFKSLENLTSHEKTFAGLSQVDCLECCTRFPSAYLYHAHKKSAHVVGSLNYACRCLICNQGFSKKKYLRHHTMHIHVEEMRRFLYDPPEKTLSKEMECRLCNTVFSERKDFLNHCLYYFDDEPYPCPTCNEKFMGQFRSHAHTKKVHFSPDKQKAFIHRCAECGEGFVYEIHLHSHIHHVHTGDVIMKNNITTDMRKRYDSSIDTVAGEKMEAENNIRIQKKKLGICDVCDTHFASVDLLRDHKREFSNSGKFRCHRCIRRLRTKRSLKFHLTVEHNLTYPSIQKLCPVCRNYILLTAWNSHLKHFHFNKYKKSSSSNYNGSLDSLPNSLQNPNVSSTINEKNTSSNDSQTASSQVTKPDQGCNPPSAQGKDEQFMIEHTCALCDLKFNSSAALRFHRSKNECEGHEYVKPIYVDNDDVIDVGVETNVMISDIYSVDLAEYENLHNPDSSVGNYENDTYTDNTGVKNKKNENFVCDVCHIDFGNAQSLGEHKINYSNDGNFKCSLCLRRFERRTVFAKHEKKHRVRKQEAEKGFPAYYCLTCDEKFASSKTKHMHQCHIHGKGPSPMHHSSSVSKSNKTLSTRTTRNALQVAHLSTDSVLKNTNQTPDNNISDVNTIVSPTNPLVPKIQQVPSHGKISVKVNDQTGQVAIVALSDEEKNLSELCDVCGLIVDSNKLKAHQNSHLQATNISLDGSMMNHTTQPQSFVQDPPQSPTILRKLLAVKRDHTYSQFQCKFCAQPFRNADILMSHYQSTHADVLKYPTNPPPLTQLNVYPSNQISQALVESIPTPRLLVNTDGEVIKCKTCSRLIYRNQVNNHNMRFHRDITSFPSASKHVKMNKNETTQAVRYTHIPQTVSVVNSGSVNNASGRNDPGSFDSNLGIVQAGNQSYRLIRVPSTSGFLILPCE